MQNLFLLAGFGLVGIFSRYGLDLLFVDANRQFPLSTFVINFLGSFVAGGIYAWSLSRDLPAGLQTALLVGFCGGFTTFSAYALQGFQLFEKGRATVALTYLVASPLCGLLGVFLGVLLVSRILAQLSAP